MDRDHAGLFYSTHSSLNAVSGYIVPLPSPTYVYMLNDSGIHVRFGFAWIPTLILSDIHSLVVSPFKFITMVKKLCFYNILITFKYVITYNILITHTTIK
jgi:hypothetical protein